MSNFASTPAGASSGTPQNSTARVRAIDHSAEAAGARVHGGSVAGAVSGPNGGRIGKRAPSVGQLWRAALCWLALLGPLSCGPARANDAEYITAVADAIYRVEGGAKTRFPYGIKSVKVSGEAEARRVCENTIRNNLARWRKAGAQGEYLDFLADRYCPPSVDPTGNFNWKKNIKKIITCHHKNPPTNHSSQ